MKIVTNDSIREVIVPDRKPVDLPEILPASEMNRLIEASHVSSIMQLLLFAIVIVEAEIFWRGEGGIAIITF